MLFLALDQSTSATKALLFDAGGRALDRESLDHRQHYPQPGWVEHDAEEIWLNTIGVLRSLLARQSARIPEIASLSITNQRETIVVFERTTGRPLHPAIVWQCRRGDAFCSEHAAAGREPLLHRKTGLKLDAYFSASKLQWLVRHRPELRAKLADGSALIGTIDTYLIHRLTAGRVFATDATNASRTLLFDITHLRWDEELCAMWEIPIRALPEVRECSARFGDTTLEGLLSQPLPIRGVMGDSQASLFAQRCFTPGSAKVTFGTGSSVLLNIGEQPRFSTKGVLTALAWTHAGAATYAFEGIIISSASTLTWLRDQLGLAADVPALEKLAREVPDNGGVYLVPAFTGLGLPHWKPAARAAISGLSSHSDRRHVARAAFESIAYQIRDALDAMRADAGVALGVLHGDGGPTASRFLMQFTADVTGTELRVATMPDCSPLGAVLAGQLGLGVRHSIAELAQVPRDDVVYSPSLDPERTQALFRGWQAAVQQVLSS
ncbi:MAG TPA: glycerol kinase GlpK [Opitutaceae bacterium]|nr:glycerol kinase GlpK [Opitutaceae bacterium]